MLLITLLIYLLYEKPLATYNPCIRPAFRQPLGQTGGYIYPPTDWIHQLNIIEDPSLDKGKRRKCLLSSSAIKNN